MSDTYNGWANWDTWNANLWLSNDEYTYSTMLKCADDAATFQECGTNLLTVDTFIDDWGKTCLKLQDYICPDKIAWDDIRASFSE